MEENSLTQLLGKVGKLKDEAEVSDHSLNEKFFNDGMSEDPKIKGAWQQRYDQGLQETLESGKAFYDIVSNPALHYEALAKGNRSNKDRYRIFQDPAGGAIWCYATGTKFSLGTIVFPFEYLPKLRGYIEQMRQTNSKLKDERAEAYKTLKSGATRTIFVRDVFPEAVGGGEPVPLTDEHMTKWELQIEWWENVYSAELKKHIEGFGLEALSSKDLTVAIDCFDYLKILGRSEVSSQISNTLAQLNNNFSDNREYLQRIVGRLEEIQRNLSNKVENNN